MLDLLEIDGLGAVNVREVFDGVYHRRIISPLDNYANEPKEIKDFCDKSFTTQIKAEWLKRKEEAEAEAKRLNDLALEATAKKAAAEAKLTALGLTPDDLKALGL